MSPYSCILEENQTYALKYEDCTLELNRFDHTSRCAEVKPEVLMDGHGMSKIASGGLSTKLETYYPPLTHTFNTF